MSYRIDFSAADVDWQIQMLKLFPEIANKHFYPAMHRASNALMASIQPNVPVRTGLARNALRKVVSGKGLNITASVGFPVGAGVAYVIPLEYGAKPHEIGYVPSLDVAIWKHPGLPALGFMANGLDSAQGTIDLEMENGMQAVVNELGKDS